MEYRRVSYGFTEQQAITPRSEGVRCDGGGKSDVHTSRGRARKDLVICLSPESLCEPPIISNFELSRNVNPKVSMSKLRSFYTEKANLWASEDFESENKGCFLPRK